jgi:ferrous iron transport protein A
LRTTINSLKGEKAIIKDFDIDIVPLKFEMGCLPETRLNYSNSSFGDPLYLNVNGSHLNSCETAQEIEVELIKITLNDQSKHQRRFNRQSLQENFGFNQLTGLNQQVGIIPELRLKKIGFANPNNVKGIS